MKHIKRGITVLLVLALTLTLVTAASLNWKKTELGDLSQYYETGSVGEKNAKPGYISTVEGDTGGTSYGIYMFASKPKPGTPYAFAKWLASYPIGSVYKTMGDTLVEAYELNAAGERVSGYGDNFDAKWESIAKMYHSEFYAAQKEYWETTSYANLIKNIKAQYPAFDMNNYSMALQNVFWSRSVQHGTGVLSDANSSDGMSGATGVIVRAIKSLGEFKNQSEEELIAAIYAECSKLDATPRTNKMTDAVAYKYGVGGQSMAYYYGNSGDVQISVYRRLHVNEPADATVMLYQKSSYTMPNGTYQILERENNQSRAISGGALKTAAEADSFKLTNYNGGYVTLSVGDNRLTDNGGSVSMAPAAANNNQMWQITNRDGFFLQNRGTGKYLSLDGSGKVVTVDSAVSESAWQISAQATVSTAGLFYPGCEKDRTNTLVAGNSSYPVRGVLTCAKPMTNVTVAVKTSSGAAAFTPASSGTINANWYDLWALDSKCTFSQLTAGDYTLTVTATVDGIPVEVAESNFTVSQNTGGKVDDETYTVTLDAAGGTCAKTSVTYKLGEVYGELPEVKKDGYEFQGWFLADGSEAAPTTPVAATSHTLTAKYGDLYTVKFLGADGSTLKTLKLAKGELITAPTNPIKAADSQYTYNFDRWEDGNGNKFTAGGTYVGESNITYTPIFTKSERSTGGGTTPPSGGGTTPPSGGTYLTGITPSTGVSALTGAGYTVYSGSKQVTSGNIATGMTAVTGSTSVTIVVTGDANGDGKLTITDVVKLQSHVVGKSSLSGAYAKAADINGDGKVTITDVVQAAQVTVGKRSLS